MSDINFTRSSIELNRCARERKRRKRLDPKRPRRHSVHARGNWGRWAGGGTNDRRSLFRCPTCASLGWYAEGTMPDPIKPNDSQETN